MHLKVNNCGECPFKEYHIFYGMNWCNHPSVKAEEIIYNESKILENCPLKTSPITIKIEENDSNK